MSDKQSKFQNSMHQWNRTEKVPNDPKNRSKSYGHVPAPTAEPPSQPSTILTTPRDNFPNSNFPPTKECTTCMAISQMVTKMQDMLTSPPRRSGKKVKMATHKVVINPELATLPDIAKQIIGPLGTNIRPIHEATGAKIRLRGIGSGHLEGPRRSECPLPLHICISATSRDASDSALARVQSLLASLNAGSTPPPQEHTLLLATVNEGKCDDTKVLLLSDWASSQNVDVCLVAEAAFAGRSPPIQPDDHIWIGPLKQRKGGAGFLIRRNLFERNPCVQITQHAGFEWALAVWSPTPDTAFISGYITPPGSNNPAVLDSFLEALSEVSSPFPKCVLGGDFNAPSSHSSSRKRLDEWTRASGFNQCNPGVITHYHKPESAGTDLDLLYARNIGSSYAPPPPGSHTGHLRQLLRVSMEHSPPTPPSNPNPRNR